MKFIILALLSLSFLALSGQDKTTTEKIDSTNFHPATKPLQSIDGQLLGSGIFLSVNYDTRFKPHNKGIGLRAGLGFAFGTTIPISINYLIGNNNKRSFLELGAGITGYIHSNQDWDLLNQPTISPNSYIMYRYQALKSPNTLRIGISQININGDFIPYYPTLSMGHILGRRR